MPESVLSVRGLSTSVGTPEEPSEVLHEVSFELPRGETVALVGESGSGKSHAGLTLLGLGSRRRGPAASGEVLFRGRNLLSLSTRERAALRGRGIAMILQEAIAALDPSLKVGDQLADLLRAHGTAARFAVRKRVLELLAMVGVAQPERCAQSHPHELSGGAARRVLVASALACQPEVLVADEPTAGVDASGKARLIAVLRRLQREHGTGIVLISHDIDLVADMATHTLVLLRGRVVESAPTAQLLAAPAHPYTRRLVAGRRPHRSSPPRERDLAMRLLLREQADAAGPRGCRFAPRCELLRGELGARPEEAERCRSAEPALRSLASTHLARCHHAEPPPPETVTSSGASESTPR